MDPYWQIKLLIHTLITVTLGFTPVHPVHTTEQILSIYNQTFEPHKGYLLRPIVLPNLTHSERLPHSVPEAEVAHHIRTGRNITGGLFLKKLFEPEDAIGGLTEDSTVQVPFESEENKVSEKPNKFSSRYSSKRVKYDEDKSDDSSEEKTNETTEQKEEEEDVERISDDYERDNDYRNRHRNDIYSEDSGRSDTYDDTNNEYSESEEEPNRVTDEPYAAVQTPTAFSSVVRTGDSDDDDTSSETSEDGDETKPSNYHSVQTPLSDIRYRGRFSDDDDETRSRLISPIRRHPIAHKWPYSRAEARKNNELNEDNNEWIVEVPHKRITDSEQETERDEGENTSNENFNYSNRHHTDGQNSLEEEEERDNESNVLKNLDSDESDIQDKIYKILSKKRPTEQNTQGPTNLPSTTASFGNYKKPVESEEKTWTSSLREAEDSDNWRSSTPRDSSHQDGIWSSKTSYPPKSAQNDEKNVWTTSLKPGDLENRWKPSKQDKIWSNRIKNPPKIVGTDKSKSWSNLGKVLEDSGKWKTTTPTQIQNKETWSSETDIPAKVTDKSGWSNLEEPNKWNSLTPQKQENTWVSGTDNPSKAAERQENKVWPSLGGVAGNSDNKWKIQAPHKLEETWPDKTNNPQKPAEKHENKVWPNIVDLDNKWKTSSPQKHKKTWSNGADNQSKITKQQVNKAWPGLGDSDKWKSSTPKLPQNFNKTWPTVTDNPSNSAEKLEKVWPNLGGVAGNLENNWTLTTPRKLEETWSGSTESLLSSHKINENKLWPQSKGIQHNSDNIWRSSTPRLPQKETWSGKTNKPTKHENKAWSTSLKEITTPDSSWKTSTPKLTKNQEEIWSSSPKTTLINTETYQKLFKPKLVEKNQQIWSTSLPVTEKLFKPNLFSVQQGGVWPATTPTVNYNNHKPTAPANKQDKAWSSSSSVTEASFDKLFKPNIAPVHKSGAWPAILPAANSKNYKKPDKTVIQTWTTTSPVTISNSENYKQLFRPGGIQNQQAALWSTTSLSSVPNSENYKNLFPLKTTITPDVWTSSSIKNVERDETHLTKPTQNDKNLWSSSPDTNLEKTNSLKPEEVKLWSTSLPTTVRNTEIPKELYSSTQKQDSWSTSSLSDLRKAENTEKTYNRVEKEQPWSTSKPDLRKHENYKRLFQDDPRQHDGNWSDGEIRNKDENHLKLLQPHSQPDGNILWSTKSPVNPETTQTYKELFKAKPTRPETDGWSTNSPKSLQKSETSFKDRSSKEKNLHLGPVVFIHDDDHNVKPSSKPTPKARNVLLHNLEETERADQKNLKAERSLRKEVTSRSFNHVEESDELYSQILANIQSVFGVRTTPLKSSAEKHEEDNSEESKALTWSLPGLVPTTESSDSSERINKVRSEGSKRTKRHTKDKSQVAKEKQNINIKGIEINNTEEVQKSLPEVITPTRKSRTTKRRNKTAQDFEKGGTFTSTKKEIDSKKEENTQKQKIPSVKTSPNVGATKETTKSSDNTSDTRQEGFENSKKNRKRSDVRIKKTKHSNSIRKKANKTGQGKTSVRSPPEQNTSKVKSDQSRKEHQSQRKNANKQKTSQQIKQNQK